MHSSAGMSTHTTQTQATRQKKDNFSFGNHQVAEINCNNHRLLDRIIDIKEKSSGVNTGGTVAEARREMEAAQNKLSSIQINRMRESKRVHSDNVKLVERLEKVRRGYSVG